jgi:hypothetical protein
MKAKSMQRSNLSTSSTFTTVSVPFGMRVRLAAASRTPRGIAD